MRLIWFRNKAPVAASSVPQCVSWRESVDTISTTVVDVKPVKKPPIHELHQNCGKLVKPWLLLLKHLLLEKFHRFERLHCVVLYIFFTHVCFLAMAYFDKFRICKLWCLCSKVFRLLYQCIRLQFICHTTQFLYDLIFIHYHLVNELSAGHVRGYRHARATSLQIIIVFVPSA